MYYKFPKQAFRYLHFVSRGFSHACVIYLPCEIIIWSILCLWLLGVTLVYFMQIIINYFLLLLWLLRLHSQLLSLKNSFMQSSHHPFDQSSPPQKISWDTGNVINPRFENHTDLNHASPTPLVIRTSLVSFYLIFWKCKGFLNSYLSNFRKKCSKTILYKVEKGPRKEEKCLNLCNLCDMLCVTKSGVQPCLNSKPHNRLGFTLFCLILKCKHLNSSTDSPQGSEESNIKKSPSSIKIAHSPDLIHLFVSLYSFLLFFPLLLFLFFCRLMNLFWYAFLSFFLFSLLTYILLSFLVVCLLVFFPFLSLHVLSFIDSCFSSLKELNVVALMMMNKKQDFKTSKQEHPHCIRAGNIRLEQKSHHSTNAIIKNEEILRKEDRKVLLWVIQNSGFKEHSILQNSKVKIIGCYNQCKKQKLAKMPAVEIQKVPGSFHCYYNLPPIFIQSIFYAESLFQNIYIFKQVKFCFVVTMLFWPKTWGLGNEIQAFISWQKKMNRIITSKNQEVYLFGENQVCLFYLKLTSREMLQHLSESMWALKAFTFPILQYLWNNCNRLLGNPHSMISYTDISQLSIKEALLSTHFSHLVIPSDKSFLPHIGCRGKTSTIKFIQHITYTGRVITPIFEYITELNHKIPTPLVISVLSNYHFHKFQA
ncbi:hypothetical protein VP01_2305g1 [Puccinia sorghi]|uniref:Uncharacterized protein n=1 Tax=Puccinia sorghi TaxID=27349 RepID=A0A0L6V7T7_9BASI|nr:hypothetical protein VP01_2305g1 [Puccinia sorghi]